MVIPLKLFLTQRERVCVWEKKRNKETLRYITRTGGPQLITGRLPVTVPGSEPTLYSWYDVELLNTIKDHLYRPSFSPLCMSQHVCFLLGPLPYVAQWDCNARIGNDLPFLTRMWFLIYPPPLSLSLSLTFWASPANIFIFFSPFSLLNKHTSLRISPRGVIVGHDIPGLLPLHHAPHCEYTTPAA